MSPEISAWSAACTVTTPPAPSVPDEALTVEASVTEAPVELRARSPPLLNGPVPSRFTGPDKTIFPGAVKLNFAGRSPEPSIPPLNDTDEANTFTVAKAVVVSAVKAAALPVVTFSAPHISVVVPAGKCRLPPVVTWTSRPLKFNAVPRITVTAVSITHGSSTSPQMSSTWQAKPGAGVCRQPPVAGSQASAVQGLPSSHSVAWQPLSETTETKASLRPALVDWAAEAVTEKSDEELIPAR